MRQKLVKLTPKQDRYVDIALNNAVSKDKKVKTKSEMLIDAGYSPKSAHNPELILSSEVLQAELAVRTAKTVKSLEDNRSRMIDLLPGKMKKAPFNHLINGVDIATKNIQLLSGKATENKSIHIEISQELADKYRLVDPIVVDEIVK